MTYNDQLYLMHHGVLGMKWGVRKRKPSSGQRKNSSKKGKTETGEKYLSRIEKRYGISSDGKMSEKGIKRAARDVKKSFNKAKTSIYSSKKTDSFGKNTEKIVEKYKKEANDSPYEKKLTAMDKEAKKLNEKYKGRFNEPEVQVLVRDFNRKYYDLQKKNTVYGRKVAEKYVGDFNKALVKDLNVPNSDEVAKYITDNQPLWDVTYISNYAWFNKLS